MISNKINSVNNKLDFWQSPEFNPLVNKEELRKITSKDPWEYTVADKLKTILFRMERRKAVNFKMSGIILHSASVLCRAKSQSIIKQGAEMQSEMDDVLSDDFQDDIESFDDDEFLDNELNTNEYTNIERIKNLKSIDDLLDVIAKANTPAERFFVKEKLSRFCLPKRIVAKPLTIFDLSKALNDALKGKYRKKNVKEHVKNIVLPEAIKKSYSDELKVENLIASLKKEVISRFSSEKKPLNFMDLLNKEHLSLILIVKTFLAILHMVNLKQVEAWQDDDGNILIIPSGLDSSKFFKMKDGNESE
ncbi:MAG: hypothetical protein ACTSXU_16695 [Promethearchaeota archaeon]